ncbi:6-phosphogluconolactonase [Haliea sp. E1-2-M8]|uniref:6-phosphogluconolactonase n=1 Tax=Haliea sp. E1-2-M8 TaxID=3064706 RepID=UPI00271E8AD4|nr:6-phosphogluconolactonase [Haliea sp. E1-2-M8]MDO8860298.1 6-phosphogluconolactonase [Haliea sp. E1-2-M8]
MSEWREFGSRGELDAALAAELATSLKADLADHPRSSLAVSGGSTPRHMFRELAAAKLDWARVAVTLVDARWVDPTDPDSNEALVRECLLRERAAAASFVGLKTPGADCTAAVAEVENALSSLPRPFAAVVLGLGGDGHTASWFPQASNLQLLLDPTNPARVAATDPVTAPHPRMTLTLAAVLDSRHIHLHITGSAKRAVLESAIARGYPVASVLAQTHTPLTIWWAPDD